MTLRRTAAFVLVLAILAACEVNISGTPVSCQDIGEVHCLERAQTGLLSLPDDHPPVTRITVTCDAEKCDDDEGHGRVILTFGDGTEEIVDIGFGRTR